ncbi:MAG: hypothetical protein U1E73_13360 [Planctomycetota bacterium]
MICKTFKWMLLTGAVLGGAGFLLLGTAFPSYVGTMASSVRESVAGQIPLDLEIKRAESLIQQIDPQIRECEHGLANSEVELDHLQESIQGMQKVVDVEEKKLKSGVRLLSFEGDAGEATLAADFGARRRVQADLLRTTDSYVNNVAILKTKRALVERQTKAVDAAKSKLMSVRAEREALRDQLVALKTQKKQVEAMNASSGRFDLDSTALSQAKEVIANVKKRLDVAQRLIENDMLFQGEDPNAVAADQRNAVKEIQDLFAANAAAPVAIEVELPSHR